MKTKENYCIACQGTDVLSLKREAHTISFCSWCNSISIIKQKSSEIITYDKSYYEKFYQKREDTSIKEFNDLLTEYSSKIKGKILIQKSVFTL